ncbi:Protein SCARECROW [Rhynchospora pubera]|uniref:Protein SCARECROW n=1 Tax=Rhynchospora pubera TaxID=906938 RepID=A0AAV8E5J6_9POAL|nr:Protein SCARECROW [Rhynchospora pubera]
MLAGYHQLSIDPVVPLQFQSRHFGMGTQRLDLPRGFSTTPRAVLPDQRNPTSCNFRPSLVTVAAATSLVSQKRFLEDDYHCLVRAKRCRTGDDVGVRFVGGGTGNGGQGVWFPQTEGREGEGEEEEEKVYFVPGSAGFPLLGSTSYGSGLVGSVETEGASSKSNSDSSSSSGTNGTETETERSGSLARPGFEGRQRASESDRYGLELVSMVVDCVNSIAIGNHEVLNYYLSRLGEEASPVGPTPIQRLAAYFTESLALRVSKLWPQWYDISPPRDLTGADHLEDDDGTALRLLNAVSPIPKFIHFTINERLVQSFEGKDRVHVIDFDIKQGLQWPSLLETLASRPNPPSHVRITGVGESRQELQETGARLTRLAQLRGIEFEFHPVVDRLEDVRLWMLHVKRDECVAVNCVSVMHKMLWDSTGVALSDFFGLVKSTNPEIVVMAEHETGHNEGIWEKRVGEAMKYYAALFDSLDACLPGTSAVRVKIEEMYAREIRNIVACKGSERVERHERFVTWKRLTEEGGFRNERIGDREMIQSRMILRMFGSPEKFGIEKQSDGEGLSIKWGDQPLYTVSAWGVSEVAGSSSTASLVN